MAPETNHIEYKQKLIDDLDLVEHLGSGVPRILRSYGKEGIPPPAPLPDAEKIDIPALLEKFRKSEIDLICVLGPTASGKTRYAVGLAKQINELAKKNICEILSGDSRQVYRRMDIGTGKDLDEYNGIPYHLIDIAEPGTRYNIYEYQKDFETAYKKIKAKGGIPILCGGSGLYIQAATCGYRLPNIPPNEELRKQLETEDIEELREKLAELRPIDKSIFESKRRLIRALEVAFHEQEHPTIHKPVYLPKKTYYIGTLVDREERIRRIDKRLDERLANGMTEEVENLLKEGVDPNELILYGLEYKFVTQYLQKIISYEEMRTLLANAIHQFSKRQMTWFRGMEKDGLRIHWTEV